MQKAKKLFASLKHAISGPKKAARCLATNHKSLMQDNKTTVVTSQRREGGDVSLGGEVTHQW